MSCTAINQNTAEEIVDTVDNVLLDCDGMMQPLFVSSPAKQEPHRDLRISLLPVCLSRFAFAGTTCFRGVLV